MSNFYDKFKSEKDEFISKTKELNDKKIRIEGQIEKKEKQLRKINDQLNNISYVGTYRLIELLAEELSRIFHLEYKIYGPFGINAESIIYFMKDKKKDICSCPTISLTLRPLAVEGNDWLQYWTGEKIDRYKEGTIGYWNNCNDVYVPLPEYISKILNILSPKIKRFNAENHLLSVAKEKGALYYSIVEDSYEYENGLTLIIYKDESENVELEHICVNVDEFKGVEICC